MGEVISMTESEKIGIATANEQIGIEVDWEVTVELRFVMRDTPITQLYHQILQQKWRHWNDTLNKWEYEWRDIPVIEDGND